MSEPTTPSPIAQRAVTIDVRRETKTARAAARRELQILREEDPIDETRPTTRAQCEGGARPCPFVGCRSNLYLDVSSRTGAIKYNFPHLAPEEMPPDRSCALDIADHDGATLSDVAAFANLTRSRVRQIEEKALAVVRENAGVLIEYADVEERTAARFSRPGATSILQPSQEAVPSDEAHEEPVDQDQLFADRMWRRYVSGDHAAVMAERRGDFAEAVRLREEKNIMANDLTERQQNILNAYKSLERELGRPPTNTELADRAGIEGANAASRQSNVSSVVGILRQRGLLVWNKTKPDAAAAPATPPKRATPATSQPTEPRTRTPKPATKPSTDDDSLVLALVAKREDLARKVEALDEAIEILRAS